jgi:hypothetical protein
MRTRETQTPSTALVETNEMTDANKSSAQLLHFVAVIDERRQLFSFVCELQPLATIRSDGRPKRCPFCQQANPVSTSLSMKKDGIHQEKI